MMLRAKNQVAILAAISSFLKRKKVNNLSVSNFYTWCIWLWPALKHCSVYIYVCVCVCNCFFVIMNPMMIAMHFYNKN